MNVDMMRSAIPLLCVACLGLSTGCVKQGEVLRTPEQWRQDVATQMDALIPDFRECYVKSKAGWAEHAKAMGGSPTVATRMKPKPRETIIISIDIESATAGEHAATHVQEGYDDTVPKADQTSDGDLANCVRKVAETKLKTPPKLDTNHGYGKWHIVFVPEASGAPAPVAPATPAPKS